LRTQEFIFEKVNAPANALRVVRLDAAFVRADREGEGFEFGRGYLLRDDAVRTARGNANGTKEVAKVLVGGFKNFLTIREIRHHLNAALKTGLVIEFLGASPMGVPRRRCGQSLHKFPVGLPRTKWRVLGH